VSTPAQLTQEQVMPWTPLQNKNNQIRNALNGNNRPLAVQYRNGFGLAASQVLNDMIADHHLAPGIGANWSKTQCLGTADTLLTLEIQHGNSARARVAALAHGVTGGTLHAGVAGGNLLAPAGYGALPADADRLKAAKWIVHCSNSLNHAGHDVAVDNTLGQIIALGLGRTLADLSAINHAFNFAPGPPPARYIDVGGGQLPAPPTGRALLEQNVTPVLDTYAPANNNQWIALACYYLGAVIRCHGFPDQNGRTGRALYALCYLWGGVPFQAITPAFEQTLHQL
jgi:hypothetical protein